MGVGSCDGVKRNDDAMKLRRASIGSDGVEVNRSPWRESNPIRENSR
jgi:hypothetical protein